MPAVVRRGERAEHRLDHGERLRRRHRRFLADQVAQGQAGDVLHHQEERAVVVAGVEDGHHVVVGQPGGRTCLALEPAYELVVVGEPLVHHLDRHRAVQPQVDGLVDGGHPAAGDLRAHAVPAVEDAPDERVGSAVHGLLHAPGGEGTRLTSHFRGSERSDPGGEAASMSVMAAWVREREHCRRCPRGRPGHADPRLAGLEGHGRRARGDRGQGPHADPGAPPRGGGAHSGRRSAGPGRAGDGRRDRQGSARPAHPVRRRRLGRPREARPGCSPPTTPSRAARSTPCARTAAPRSSGGRRRWRCSVRTVSLGPQ